MTVARQARFQKEKREDFYQAESFGKCDLCPHKVMRVSSTI